LDLFSKEINYIFGSLAQWIQSEILTEDGADNVIELYLKNVLAIYTKGEIVKGELDFFNDYVITLVITLMLCILKYNGDLLTIIEI